MDTLYNELSSTLQQLLVDRNPKIEPTQSNTFPLFLLLDIKPDLVCFATLNGQPEEDFSKAFKNFRDLYSIHSNEWVDFDLTLVLCKNGAKKVTDEFCTKIELDPYFCRKFVIDLNRELNTELGRLPFIPLHPESIVGLKRPISAQTFLMKHGITSALARYLVVPHARGIERITEECIKGLLGKSDWHKTEIEELLLPQYEVRPKVRLKELEINNFRAYRENYKFNLDADLVVLFGPNGFGKTSFFDAVDFICTGSVGRFDERFGKKTDRLPKVLKHLDSSIDDSFVKATTLIDNKEVPLARYMKDRTRAYINEVLTDRTKTLMLLTGLLEELPDLRIENLVRLFRATHLFGQEFQSLTMGLRDKSKLPKDTVSRMLAFQDYVEAINKARKVSEEFKRQIKEKESEINFLRGSLKSKEVEINQLSQSAKIVEKPEALLVIGRQIAEKIIRETGIPMEIPTKFKKELTREWGLNIAIQKNSITQNLEIIEKLEAKFPELVNHRKKIKEKSFELTQRKELLDKVNKDYFEEGKKLEEVNEKLKKSLLEEKNLVTKRENFNWLLQAKGEYEQLKEQTTKENRHYRDVQAELLNLVPKSEKLKSENKATEENISKITSEIKILENSLKEISDFEKGVDDWVKTTDRQKELKIHLQKLEQQVVNMKNELRIKKDELNTVIITEDKLRRHLADLQQSRSELQTLLDTIERHIFNNICPVCGTFHQSREALIEKLTVQRGNQPQEVQETLKLFENTKAKTDELKKHTNDLELRFKQSEQQVIETQKELFDVEEKIKTHEEKAAELGISKTFNELVATINSKKKNILEQMDTKHKELSEQKSKMGKKQEEINILAKPQESLEQDLQNIKSKLNQLQLMIDKVGNDALTRQVSLEFKKENIQRNLTNVCSIIEELHKQIEMLQTESQNFQKKVNSIVEKKKALEREIQELDKEIFGSKKYIEEVESLINRLKLNFDIDIGQVQILKKDFMGNLASLDLLQNEIINFEIALDVIETSAALAKIQQDIESTKKQIQNIENDRDRLKEWQVYFDVACKELEFIQNRALKEYTEKYGPLTSAIQRRLRLVYGFGDIGLHQEKGGIAVRVERKEEKNIPPSDYFSESQIQIVMLSLFLSAALTQTWSSFAPILLDDPVTHFDDLNTYSLLELIRGLITEPGNERQFIISTCEDRLFRLMRQKFSKMNSKVIFYVFESIGEKGPNVKSL